MKGHYFHLQRDPFGRSLALTLSRSGSGLGEVATSISYRESDFSHADPVMHIEMADAQQLMDELWHCGIRPTEGAGSAGAMRAVENHLADLRRITNKLLKIDG